MNPKTSKHRIPLSSLRLNHLKQDSHLLQLLYISIAIRSLLSGFLGAMTMLKVPMFSALGA
jgi:hypothetical protein